MKNLFVLLLLLCPLTLARAEEKVTVGAPTPKVTVDAPNSFARDKMILFKLSGIEGSKVRVKWWIRSDDGRIPPDFQVFDEGKTCVVWAPPGKYEALVTVGVIEASDILWFDVEHKFTVEGSSDPPNPPKPPDVSSDFGDVTATILKLAEPVKDADGKADASKIIAEAYRKHGQLAAKGEYTDQNVLADATASEFVYALGLNRYVRWRPMMTRIREHMAKLMAEGKLKDKDMPTWAKLWEEYAKGFDAVAKTTGITDGNTQK